MCFRHLFVAIVAVSVLLAGCAGLKKVDRRLVPPDQVETLDDTAPFLKVYMPDGTLYVLKSWTVFEDRRVVHGTGVRHDPARSVAVRGEFTVPIDSVTLFETNTTEVSEAIIPMAVMTGVSVAMTVVCVTNPKACFGSCPTFYVEGATGPPSAEGFSSSVAPWLEATDQDALRDIHPTRRRLEITMRNEALETHVVRRVDLVVAPRPPGGRVVQDLGGTLWQAFGAMTPGRCVAREGDVTALLSALDGRERTSEADSTDLGARETIDVVFDRAPAGRCGLVVALRQSLLPTFLLYQTLSDMGRAAGDWFTVLSKNSAPPPPVAAMAHVDVLVPSAGGGWRLAGRAGEHGPLATEVHVVPLPPAPGGIRRVRLDLTRGAWRIDQVALVALGDTVAGEVIPPDAVMSRGARDDDALSRLWDDRNVLTTMPGDAYTLVYELPDHPERHEVFLRSRGYYLEWMRREWLADENPLRVGQMLFATSSALRRLAPAYKKVEPTMESIFWRSKYAPR